MSDLDLDLAVAAAAAAAKAARARGQVQPNPDGTYGEVPPGYTQNPATGQYVSRENLTAALSPSRGQAFMQGVVQGGTFAAADEAAGLVGGGYERERMRAELDAARRDYPWTTIAGEVAGGIAVPVAPVLRGGNALAKAAGLGAVAGSIYGAFSGEGGISDRAAGAGLGLVAGATGGAASVPIARVAARVGREIGNSAVGRLFTDRRVFDPSTGQLTDRGREMIGALGYNADEVSTAFAREFQKEIGRAVEPQAAARAAELSEFGIPAYRHNITGAPEDFATFERGRRGASGETANARIRTAAEAQDQAARDAAERIALGMGGNGPADQADAAAAVMDRARSVAASEKASAQAAYGAADAAGVTVPGEVMSGVRDRIADRLAREQVDLVSSRQAADFMRRLEIRDTGAGDAVSLRMVDGVRKDLNRAITKAQSDPAEARALTIIKDEYDQWFDDVVSSRLFSGDEAGIAELQRARELWSDYARKFVGKDGPQRFIADMVEADASPDQVVRWMFGSSKLGMGRMGEANARALREVLGDGSDEWGMVRQAAFRHMTMKPEGTTQWGPQRISENILGFVNGPGTRGLAREMFSPEELTMMRRYAGALKRMVPPPGAVNYSGTAYENARMVQQTFRALAGAVGFGASGGTPGTGLAAAAAVGAGQATRGWLASRAMLRGTTPAPGRNVAANPLGIGAAAITTGQGQARPQ
jgi:hypothetical protein